MRDVNNNINVCKESIGTDYTYKHEIVWKNVLGFLIIHVLGGYGGFLLLSGALSYKTILYFCALAFVITQAITAGVHRYYTHRCYKAKPLLQNSIFTWVRDHRLHHRYSDTDADPHNSNRGFFFSHMGWLMTKKHPYVIELGRKVDMSDLLADPLVMWQYKYFYELFFIFGIIIPVAVPVYFGETWMNSICYCGFYRYILSLHLTWLVNSLAHFYGTRPYDKNLQPVESWWVSVCTMGEGWHNYHHAFPWDYKAAELGMHINFTASFIRFLKRVGLAYDLKTASPQIVEKRIIRTGDGTHHLFRNDGDRSASGPLHPLNPTNTSSTTPDATLDLKRA